MGPPSMFCSLLFSRAEKGQKKLDIKRAFRFEVTRYFNLLFKPSQRSLTLQISLIWTPIFGLCGACDTVTTVIWLKFFPQYWIVSTLISNFEVRWHLTILIPYPAKSFWAGMRRSKIYGGKIVSEPHLELFKNITNFREGLLGPCPCNHSKLKVLKVDKKTRSVC